MLGVEEVDKIDDESTCRQINLFKSDSLTSSNNLSNLSTSLARNSLRKTLFSARSIRSGKMVRQGCSL